MKLFCNHNYEILKQIREPGTLERLIGTGVTAKKFHIEPAVVLTIYKCCKCNKVYESKVIMAG